MPAAPPPPSVRPSEARFPPTPWTVVLAANQRDQAASGAALESLCQAYWSPLYAFLRRDDPSLTSHDAQDLVQGFVARLIERGDLETISPEKGRFRTYLLAGLRNFRIKQALRDKAAKRDWRREVPLLDTDQAEELCGPDLRDGIQPERAFDRQFARVALARALETLRAEFQARGKTALFDALAPFLDGASDAEYDAVASRLGLRRGTVAVTVHRMRGRLKVLLRAEFHRLVGPGGDAEAEMRSVLEALAS